MQRTVRILRVALPVVFVAFVARDRFNWRARQTAQGQGRRRAGDVTADRREAAGRSRRGSRTRRRSTAGWSRASGRGAWSPYSRAGTRSRTCTMTIYRPNGLTYELVCPQAQFNSQTKEADAKGGVTRDVERRRRDPTAADALRRQPPHEPHPGQFKVDRWTGNAGALDIDVEARRCISSTTSTPRWRRRADRVRR